MIDLNALHARLIELDGLTNLNRADLQPAKIGGLAHFHISLSGRGLIVRAPRRLVWNLTPNENIAYQAESFRRAQPSGHVPRLAGALEPDVALPFGALIVEEIKGCQPNLPDDFARIARALARIHAMPVPSDSERPPLKSSGDPTAEILVWIEEVAPALERIEIPAASQQAIEEELAWARHFAVEAGELEQPTCLVMNDAHPGNFLINADDVAIFVDIDMVIYGSPAADIARISLRPPLHWRRKRGMDVDVLDVARFYRVYLDEIGRESSAAIRPWLTPMRRLIWLRHIFWGISWLAEMSRPDDLPVHFAQALEKQIRSNLNPAEVARMRDQWLGEEPLDMVL